MFLRPTSEAPPARGAPSLPAGLCPPDRGHRSKEPGDVYTEAESGAAYLEAHGVPADRILEAGGNDSWFNLADLAPELRDRNVHTILMVTDPFHEDRSMAIASDLGFTPHPTPTQTSPITGLSTVPYFLKEALGVGLGRIIGFQNLHAFG